MFVVHYEKLSKHKRFDETAFSSHNLQKKLYKKRHRRLNESSQERHMIHNMSLCRVHHRSDHCKFNTYSYPFIKEH